MELYPHSLYRFDVSAAVQDGSGNWNATEGSWTFHSYCREETNGKGQQITGPDGKALIFSSTIYLPKSAGRISEGSTIRVMGKDGQQRIKGQALKFDNGQLHSRLWV